MRDAVPGSAPSGRGRTGGALQADWEPQPPGQARGPAEVRKPDAQPRLQEEAGGLLCGWLWGRCPRGVPGLPFIPGKALKGKASPSKPRGRLVPGRVPWSYALLCASATCGHTCSRDCRELGQELERSSV